MRNPNKSRPAAKRERKNTPVPPLDESTGLTAETLLRDVTELLSELLKGAKDDPQGEAVERLLRGMYVLKHAVEFEKNKGAKKPPKSELAIRADVIRYIEKHILGIARDENEA